MAKRLPLEQILLILQEATTQGNIRKVCQQYGVSERSFYRWRSRFGGLQAAEALQVDALKQENRELKQLVGELTLKMTKLCGL